MNPIKGLLTPSCSFSLTETRGPKIEAPSMAERQFEKRQTNKSLQSVYHTSRKDKGTTMRLQFSIAFLALTAWPSVIGWTSLGDNPQCGNGGPSSLSKSQDSIDISSTEDWSRRRNLLATFASASFALASITPPAFAADRPQEFSSVGTQAPPPDGSSPFVTLESGVKIKDFQVGSGDGTIGPSSQVSIQCSGRLLNLNGEIFYNTKNNNPDGFGAIPLVVDLGKGQAVPGLEAGLVGMKKGGVRRIIVPEDLAYNKVPDLEPKPMNANDQRALDSVVKNPRRDGAILFDVKVERFK
jgi:FKBP-type peptidyl-prolyl cis-trans isomerase